MSQLRVTVFPSLNSDEGAPFSLLVTRGVLSQRASWPFVSKGSVWINIDRFCGRKDGLWLDDRVETSLSLSSSADIVVKAEPPLLKWKLIDRGQRRSRPLRHTLGKAGKQFQPERRSAQYIPVAKIWRDPAETQIFERYIRTPTVFNAQVTFNRLVKHKHWQRSQSK